MNQATQKVLLSKQGPHGLLSSCGAATSQETVEAILTAWKVEDRYLLNPALGNKPPKIDTDNGPKYLLKIDGRWYYCYFGGLNGPPCYTLYPTVYGTTTAEDALGRFRVLISRPDGVPTLETLAAQAVEVQNASNPIAVAKHFGEAIVNLRDRLALDKKPNDSDAIANHPIYRIWANKIHSIAGMEVDTTARFSDAYNQVLLMQIGALPE
jgi:hypothetical protein